jgi:hypothetical protein
MGMQLMRHKNAGKLRWWLGAIASGLLLGGFVAPVKAQESFGADGIRFDVDTIVEFEFIKSDGAYQSTFGIVNLETGERTPLFTEVKPSDNPQPLRTPSDYSSDVGTNDNDDFLGTPGNTVPEPLAEFRFQPNTRYAFYLESTFQGRPAGVLYSTNFQSQTNGSRFVKFEGGLGNLADQGITIIWEDTGSVIVGPNAQDRDFDDFLVRAGGHLACPYGAATSQQQSQLKSANPTSNGMLISQASCR